MPGSQVLSNGLACFRAVTTANCHHQAVVAGGKHPNDLPQFRWINTLLGNVKTSFNGTFHAFNFDKYARRYLGGYCFRFNRRFSMATMTDRIQTPSAAACSARRGISGSRRLMGNQDPSSLAPPSRSPPNSSAACW